MAETVQTSKRLPNSPTYVESEVKTWVHHQHQHPSISASMTTRDLLFRGTLHLMETPWILTTPFLGLNHKDLNMRLLHSSMFSLASQVPPKRRPCKFLALLQVQCQRRLQLSRRWAKPWPRRGTCSNSSNSSESGSASSSSANGNSSSSSRRQWDHA